MKDNGSNARVTEEVMAKDKKKPVQQDEKMPAEAHGTVEQNSAENRAENSEDNGGVTLSRMNLNAQSRNRAHECRNRNFEEKCG